MKSVPVDDLPEELAGMVADFAEYLRRNIQQVEGKGKKRKLKPSDFLETDLGVKEPLTRREIYEDV